MSEGRDSAAGRVRALLADLAELVQVRLELLGVEAREDLAQLATIAGQGLLALVLASFGLIFLALLLTVALWDSGRLLPLGIFTAIFLGGGLILGVLAWRRVRRGLRLFRSSLEELRRDRERLRS